MYIELFMNLSTFVSKIADVGIPETPTPLASANFGNGDPLPPENGDVLNGWSLSIVVRELSQITFALN